MNVRDIPVNNTLPLEQQVIDYLRLLQGLRSPTGRTFHVNNADVRKSDKPGAGGMNNPFATLDYAIGRCNAAYGDHILVWPGHAETLSGAAGVALDVAGVKIFGLGQGTNRPAFTMSAVASTFDVSAANCAVRGLRFISNAANTRIIQLKDGCTDCVIEGNRFQEGSAQFLTAVDIVHANVARCRINGNEFKSYTANAVSAIKLNVAADAIEISGNRIRGNFSTAGIIISAAATRCHVRDNAVDNAHATGKRLSVTAAATGYFCEDANGGAGTLFTVIKKGIAVTAFTVTTGTDMTLASIGDIHVRDVYLKSSGGTVTTATALEIWNTNVMGQVQFLTQTVGGLHSTLTTIRGSSNGSTVRPPGVLEAGKKIQTAATGASGAGTATFDVILVCERITPGAWLEAA